MTESPVVCLDDLVFETVTHGASFEARLAPLALSTAALAGGRGLGARLIEVAPGKKAFPYHCHHANSEMFVILDGTGEVRFGGRVYGLKAGDVVACPPGGPETAHQITASAGGPLRYLAISTMNEPDIMDYPDSGKITLFAGAPPGGDKAKRRVSLTVRPASAVDYWDGEA
ncbi:cupin [Rhodospirillum rubrum]|uniref:cupin domain-containing protein n=1 Tax=Rhodospirillum rubrum TaxID=1085 RepID=UPI0019041FCE|nr:cupin domain-containing protein [Rhodospirillum rubrum]MBK1663482.1 cupin [Rhodospirillum rubrum]MBK1675680.1 cupin [Rhodospirillum rubrum]